MGIFRIQNRFMTHATHGTCDLLLFRKNKKFCKTFVNRNENVVTLHSEK
jgi:hypothetical protein